MHSYWMHSIVNIDSVTVSITDAFFVCSFPHFALSPFFICCHQCVLDVCHDRTPEALSLAYRLQKTYRCITFLPEENWSLMRDSFKWYYRRKVCFFKCVFYQWVYCSARSWGLRYLSNCFLISFALYKLMNVFSVHQDIQMLPLAVGIKKHSVKNVHLLLKNLLFF